MLLSTSCCNLIQEITLANRELRRCCMHWKSSKFCHRRPLQRKFRVLGCCDFAFRFLRHFLTLHKLLQRNVWCYSETASKMTWPVSGRWAVKLCLFTYSLYPDNSVTCTEDKCRRVLIVGLHLLADRLPLLVYYSERSTIGGCIL